MKKRKIVLRNYNLIIILGLVLGILSSTITYASSRRNVATSIISIKFRLSDEVMTRKEVESIVSIVKNDLVDQLNNHLDEKKEEFNKAVEEQVKIIKDDLTEEISKNVLEEAKKQKPENFDEIVDKVIRGDYGNGEERRIKLEKDGFDYKIIQALVNYKLGY